MNEDTSHEWQPVTIKAVGEKTISVEAKGVIFEIPASLVAFPVRTGDTVYIRLTDEVGKKKDQVLLAKEILNTIFGNAEKRDDKENT